MRDPLRPTFSLSDRRRGEIYKCVKHTLALMASVKFYTVIYIALLGLATSKVLFFEFFAYWDAVGATMVTAVLKTLLIMGYFQHLRFEPRSLTYLMSMGMFAVFLLTVAASFSIT
jgi:cytochrome c oxidase subunit 4